MNRLMRRLVAAGVVLGVGTLAAAGVAIAGIPGAGLCQRHDHLILRLPRSIVRYLVRESIHECQPGSRVPKTAESLRRSTTLRR